MANGAPPPISTHLLLLHLSALLLLTPSAAQSCARSVPNATLVGLTVSAGCTLHPPFDPNEHYYSCAIPHAADSVSLTPIPAAYYEAQVEVRVPFLCRPLNLARPLSRSWEPFIPKPFIPLPGAGWRWKPQDAERSSCSSPRIDPGSKPQSGWPDFKPYSRRL